MTKDNVNHPSHYTQGRAFEVIDVLEDWAKRAPDPVKGGLHWNSCKYLGRLWDKENPLQDAKKARWYLDRLISKLEQEEQPVSPYAVTYEDVLEDYAACAVQGEELVAEYGVQDVDDEGDRQGKVGYGTTSPTAQLHVDVDDQPLAHWDSDDDYMWDPTLGPVELSEEEVQEIRDNKDLDQFFEDEIISIVERRGLIIGVKRDGSTCLLNGKGECSDNT